VRFRRLRHIAVVISLLSMRRAKRTARAKCDEPGGTNVPAILASLLNSTIKIFTSGPSVGGGE
jgi:hypothetical protein